MSQWRRIDTFIRIFFFVPIFTFSMIMTFGHYGSTNTLHFALGGVAVMMLTLGINAWRFNKRKDALTNFICGVILLLVIGIVRFIY
ncbi:hypothetical protein [Alkalicoccobacillus murimartini]|uniref:Uncharacterized membrane protein YdcZ (DUF606 family) n=1 Tax=Alkalicoccobacillus murimartini TaxID=171685 RepID=A0ABT9YEB5_9BACI|nr:hypothetical protein [Alkalicoccobacillus murimartini]MDQ0205379.1 uncharacterized membrane protein YdcZ (DUF606 family) [Alkalicoccobacillus murimartini]